MRIAFKYRRLGIIALFAAALIGLSAFVYLNTEPETSNSAMNDKLSAVQVNGLVYTGFYKTPEYRAQQEFKLNPSEHPEQFRDAVQSMSNSFQLLFTIKAQNGMDPLKLNCSSDQEYYDRAGYYTNGFGRDIYLVDEQDTVSALFDHWERDYGISKEQRIHVDFGELEPKGNNTHLLFWDRAHQTYPIRLPIFKEDWSATKSNTDL